jgi:hypothetical protein
MAILPLLKPPLVPDEDSLKQAFKIVVEDIKKDAQVLAIEVDPSFTPDSGSKPVSTRMEAKDVSLARLRSVINKAKNAKGPERVQKTTNPPAPPPKSPLASNAVRQKGVSDADTIAYQNMELIKELLLLESHLKQGCMIFGKPCDCCKKHPVTILALAEETYGITGQTSYQEIGVFCKKIMPYVAANYPRTKEVLGDPKTGEVGLYGKFTLEARSFRKTLMGSGIK